MSLIPKPAPFDFETNKIEPRPHYPPRPVGLALERGYLAWDHPTENNATLAEGRRAALEDLERSGGEAVFHNSAFDVSIFEEHLGVRFPDPEKVHDTLFLAFLSDPRATSLSLKPLAEARLGRKPKERDALRAWVLRHCYDKGKDSKRDPWGAHIAAAPGSLVGRYAGGDVAMTRQLFAKLYPEIERRGMLEAYRREQRCRPIFERMSVRGIRVDVERLRRDLRAWERAQAIRAEWVRKRLRVARGANVIDGRGRLVESFIDSGSQLADALEAAGKVSHWVYTPPSKSFPNGQRSTSRDNLIEVCTDAKLIEELRRYGVLQTYITTFARPWLSSAEANGGRVFPSFHQVRSTEEYTAGFGGTRTGRPSSSSPNLLNVPRNQDDPQLPNMRHYLVPDDGCVFLVRDYSQQELRILAHYEEGALLERYRRDPTVDAHELVRGLIREVTGLDIARRPVKDVNFGKLYGLGVPGLAKKLGCSIGEARDLVKAHEKALPDVKGLIKGITDLTKAGKPIVTWGGREYFVEEPKVVVNKHTRRPELRDFHYKMLNYLIQGSAADCTKEAMVRLASALHRSSELVLQVYDELVVQCEVGRIDHEMKVLREAMESIEFDVPMLSDGKLGRKSWGQTVKYNDRR